MTALEQHRIAWPDKSDEWLFERLDRELKSKVDTIHNLLEENQKLNEALRWRDPKEELPEFISGCDYSNNVLAHVEGFTETQVMCLLFIPDDEGGWGYVWANCYGDINGEAEWDDDYKVIGWRPVE